MGLFLFIDRPASVCEWVSFPIVWPHTTVRTKLKWPPPRAYFLVEWPQLLYIFPSEEKIRLSSLTDFFASLLEIQMAQFNQVYVFYDQNVNKLLETLC